MALTTLAEAKAYMGVTSAAHDAEITRLVEQADDVVLDLAGESPYSVSGTENVRSSGGVLLLSRYPVTAVTSLGSYTGSYGDPYQGGYLSSYDGDLTTGAPIINGAAGIIQSPYADGTWVSITYTAGLAAVPAAFVDAALVFVSYKYRRNHGGSESYMPSGVDGSVAPPMGTSALREQIRLALGRYARTADSIA